MWPVFDDVWQVDTDEAGIAYVGTFPGFAGGSTTPPAMLGAYDKETGQWRDYGTFGDQYTYIRSTAVVGDTVYVGTGTVAAMFAVDIVTGEKTEIPLPEGRTDCTFTYEMATSGTDLFVHFQCASGNGGAIYDTVTGEWVTDFIPNMNPQRVGRDASGTTWFTAGGALHSISPDREITSTDLAVGTKGIGVVTEGDSEYVVSIYGNVLHRYDISTGDLEELVLDLSGTPTNPRSSVVGPDGRLHFGGYFSGGFATYDTTSDEWAFEAALGQTEGFATVGDTLYAGRYPGAKLEAIDTSKALGDGNPVRALDLDPYGQDRPFALTDAGGLVAVGTVPEYGSLIGALAIHDPVTKQNDVYRNIIEDQSITALAYENGILYGGTSVYGGNGAFPTQQNARVFAFDMATRELCGTSRLRDSGWSRRWR